MTDTHENPNPLDDARPRSESVRAIEAILMVADEPVTPQILGELLEINPAADRSDL